MKGLLKKVFTNPIFIFLIATIVFTWPQVANINSQITDQGDPYFVTWVMKTSIDKIKNLDFKDFWQTNTFYPYPDSLAFSDHSVTLTLQAYPVSFFNSTQTFLVNYTQLLGFFLSALFAYYLIFYYTKNKKAALIAGIIYGLSPYHLGIMNHLQIASYQYMPLLILFLEKFIKDHRLRHGLFFALAFILNALVSLYLFVFSIIPIAIILLVRLITRELKLDKKLLLNTFISGLLICIVCTPLYLPYLKVSDELNTVRSVDEVKENAAKPADFLVSLPNHIYMGQRSSSILRNDPKFNRSERLLFFGFLTLLACLLCFVDLEELIKKHRIKLKFNPTKVIFLILAVSAVTLSFGPYVSVLGHRVYTPGYFLYDKLIVFKAIRAPARYNVLTILSIAVLAGYFISSLSKLLKRKYIVNIIIVLIALEQLVVPVAMGKPVELNADLYQWTSEHIDKSAVFVHYPFYVGLVEYLRVYNYDPRPIFNGYSGIFPDGTRRMMDLASFDSFSKDPKPLLEILATLGVSYFVLHNKSVPSIEFDKNLKSGIESIKSVKKVISIANDDLYDISGLRNDSLLNTPLNSSVALNGNRADVVYVDGEKTSWVNKDLKTFRIEFDYYKKNVLVAKRSKEIFKPLFLLPGQDDPYYIDVPGLILTKYDRVEARLIN